MAKRVYIGVGGKARRVRKVYFGVGSKARKVKKAYIGIGGVARPFWNDGTVTYYGAVTALSQARRGVAAGSINGKALFAGGLNYFTDASPGYANVDVYDGTLTRTSATELSVARGRFKDLGKIDDDLIFIPGGWRGATFFNTVDVYNKNLTRSTTTMSASRANIAGMSVGIYCLLAGGTISGDAESTVVDAFNASLTRMSATALYYGGPQNACNVAGTYALYGHRRGSTAYNADLTRQSSVAAVTATYDMSCGMSFGQYGFFSGQYDTAVSVYDKTLTKTNVTAKSVAAGSAGTILGDYALIGGGYMLSGGFSAHMDCYDDRFTRTTITSLGQSGGTISATTVGDYALFQLGENSGSTTIGNVYAYTLV